MRDTNNICVFDIRNIQQEYAYVLQFINSCEKGIIDKSTLIEIAQKISIKGGVVERGIPVRYYEEPIEKVINISERELFRQNGIEKLTEIKATSFNEKTIKYFLNQHMLYHIRIHMDCSNLESNCFNLQYLALILQNFEDLFVGMSDVKKRLSVFIVPIEGVDCPYIKVNETNVEKLANNEIFERISHYLRLLSKEYAGIIYSAKLSGKQLSICPLDYSISPKTNEFFPVLILDQDNYKYIFEKNLSCVFLEELFNLKNNRRFRNAASSNPQEALCDYIAETAMRRLQKNIESESVREEIKNILLKKEGINLIELSVFSFVLKINRVGSFKQDIAYTWENTTTLCAGIRQLLQNSIQHSEKKKCIFSFLLKKEKDFERLYLTISDLNFKQSMLENFIENLSWEYENIEDKNKLYAHKMIIDKKEQISLRNLFGEFEASDNLEVWKIFRQQDISAHVGLILFIMAAERCNASVEVRNSTDYRIQNNNKTFYLWNCKEHDMGSKEERVVPGTQFVISIPLLPLKKISPKGLGQLKLKDEVQENYQSFAECLTYESKEIECLELLGDNIKILDDKLKIANPKEKFRSVQRWSEIWREVINQHIEKIDKGKYRSTISYLNMENLEKEKYFQSEDNMEVFFKGFFEVIIDLEERYNINFFAFIGMKLHHVKLLRDICIAFSPRRFPENIQIYVGEKNCVDNLLLFGTNYHQVIKNGYLVSIEHGSKIINTLDYIKAKSLLDKLLMTSEEQKCNTTQIVPFDVLLPYNKTDKSKMFDKRLKALADNDIYSEDAGFLIRNTHMRLGSKVHIQSFYEMSFLFYRTSIANRIAFEILHDLYLQNSDGIININYDKIIFYGYASYSKAILTSLVEMLRIYRKMNDGAYNEVSFISYQHNLQSESEEIKMYFGFDEKFSACLKDDKVYSKEKIKIVQVVPIGSTLTTFEKMWSRFKKALHDDAKENFVLLNNYTVFWVTNGDKPDLQVPSEIEEEYWAKASLKDRVVETRFKEFQNSNSNLIRYFIQCPVNWRHPLKCDLCYPSSVIDEIPLVETDPTSTVPTQQIRKRKSLKINNSTVDEHSINERLKELKGCVSYGHIVREQNHFQYYIDTQAYFYKVKEQVKEWLGKCNRETESVFPVMHIIFSPEHNTNVGFAQYVNTYYFGGVAEIVSINEDKEFRSNFECEHAALIQTISDLHKYVEVNSFEEMPVKFYYVDDTIISGETFQKANSFLRTLLPPNYRNRYGTNVISKCFLLIDRMSNETKRNYVRDTNNDFYSFLHIDISNMRTQGDSCVGCKLRQDATRLFKRSATYKMEKYWADKIKNNETVQYDNKKEIVRYQTDDAYEKMIISHVAQNAIFISNNSFEIGNTYDVILALAFDLLGVKKINNVHYYYKDLIKELRGVHGLSIFLKIISRPFFSFDFKIKMQVLTLITILTEFLIGNKEQVKKYTGCLTNELKHFLSEANRLNNTIQLGEEIERKINDKDKLKFIKNVLMESLTDMKSTYLLRIQSVKSMYHFLSGYEMEYQEDFWSSYARNVHCIVHCSSDEMRSLNLEYVLLTGKEYSAFTAEKKEGFFKPIFLYNAVTGKEIVTERDPFFLFCHELLFQNNRILFDGIEKELEREASEDTYFMGQWRHFRCLETFKVYDKNNDKDLPSSDEIKLFTYLKDPNALNFKGQVNERYVEWLTKICEMFKKKYSFRREEIKTCLLTWTKEDNDNSAKIGELDILTEINMSDSMNKFDAKEKIVNALNCEKNKSKYYLKDDGYMISESESTSYFILYFNNSNVDVKTDIKRSLKPIAKVFLFFEIANRSENNFFMLRFMLRDILVYRNRIMRMLESNFEGDMFTKYAHTIGEKNIIAHEKASSHSNSYDDENILNFLLNQSAHIKYENLDSSQAAKWLIMRNYVNEQIAKLFNRSFQNTSSALKENQAESPSLYLDDKVKLYMNESLYNNKLENFQDLNLIMDDRFILLESIINIKYNEISNKKFIVYDGLGYNAEFFKCVLIDIIFSAIKYQADKYEFLLQINYLLNVKKLYRNEGLINRDNLLVQCKEYKIEFLVESTNNEKFDYLVIRNPIYRIINDYEYMNEEIRKKMEDPLDFADGHLSLLTIKRYIEGLSNDLNGKCRFQYYKTEEDVLWFETRLPVIRKEDA